MVADSTEPVPISEVPRRANETLEVLRAIAGHPGSPEIEQIELELPTVAAELEQLTRRVEAVKPGLGARRELDDLEQSYLLQRARLDAWQRALEEQWRRLQIDRGRLDTLRRSWEATESSAELARETTLSERVVSLRAQIEEAEQGLRQRIDELLGLEGRVAELHSRIGRQLEALDAKLQSSRDSLADRDSPPLWSRAVIGEGLGAILLGDRQARVRNVTAISDALRAGQIALFFQLLVFIALAGVLYFLRRRIGAPVAGEPTRAMADVLAHPFSAALLIVLLLAPWFHRGAPILLFELAMLLSVAPVLRLLVPLLAPGLRGALLGLAGVYALDQLRSLLASDPLQDRLLLLAVGAAGLAVMLGLLLKPALFDRLQSDRWRGAVRAGLRLGVLLLGIALVVNPLGFVQLATVLTEGALKSAYAAIVLRAAVLVVEGLLRALPRSRPGNALLSIRNHPELVRRRGVELAVFWATIVWVITALRLFDLWRPLRGWVSRVLAESWSLGEVEISLGRVLGVVLVLVAAVYLSRLVRFLVEEDVFPRAGIRQGEAAAAKTLLHYLIMALGIFTAAAVLGFSATQITVVAGALGVGIGFGLQSIANNFVSGLILIFERPIKVGDRIEVGAQVGIVQRIGIRASTLRTWDGAEVVIPNGDLLSSQVVNWTLSDLQRRAEIKVGAAYGTDPRRVLQILEQVAAKHPEVLGTPEPVVLFLGFGESSLDFALRFWTATFDETVRVASELRVSVSEAFADAGITIPFPQRDLHLRSLDPEVRRLAMERISHGLQTTSRREP